MRYLLTVTTKAGYDAKALSIGVKAGYMIHALAVGAKAGYRLKALAISEIGATLPDAGMVGLDFSDADNGGLFVVIVL